MLIGKEREREREKERERERERIHSEETTTLHMLHHFLWSHFSLSWEGLYSQKLIKLFSESCTCQIFNYVVESSLWGLCWSTQRLHRFFLPTDLRYHCDWGAYLCWEMPHCVYCHWRNSPFLHRTLKPLRRHRISLCSCESTLHAFHTRTSFHLKSYSFLILSLLRSISSLDMLPKLCRAGSSIWCL